MTQEPLFIRILDHLQEYPLNATRVPFLRGGQEILATICKFLPDPIPPIDEILFLYYNVSYTKY